MDCCSYSPLERPKPSSLSSAEQHHNRFFFLRTHTTSLI
ncbi:hypothetical protein XELAEV_180297382mg, partial [Xenopus laevis]